MCSSDTVSKEVNRAKCASIGALICGILACLGFAANGWLAGIGGILAIIASSMLICCGPTARGQGKCMHTASFILYIIATIACAVGIILALVAYFQILNLAHQSCDDFYEDDAQVSACVNLAMGIVGLFIWPAVVLAALSAAMDIWGAVTSYKAMGAIDKEAASPQFPATGIPVSNDVQLTVAASVP